MKAGRRRTHMRMKTGTRETHGFTYKGIKGVIVCRDACTTADDSSLVDRNNNFGDGWYFVPVEFKGEGRGAGGSAEGEPIENKSKWRFVEKDNGDYEQAMFVSYGMWLDENKVIRSAVDRKYGMANGNPVLDDSDSDLVPTATYQGNAEGLAARKDGTDDMASGQFEADVRLTAEFDTNLVLHGHVNNFRPADPVLDSKAVDTNWSVQLFNRDRNKNDGWTATEFGKDNERPEGFYGDFHHTFKDDDGADTGRVAGVYVAD